MMAAARFVPPDHSKGDEATIGGYAAVHDRPAAFEGADGFSYSVEIMAEQAAAPDGPWVAFFLFVKWARIGAQSPEGHLESDYLARGATEADARQALGRTRLDEVKRLLDALIAERRQGAATRPWWDAMRDEGE
ncbi:MAG TPA: hypothetical protein VN600_15430 [Gemmatimonadaceae bacterium]|nr:hypothetical protein [Gemmatimonadaceae bacterium]